MVSLVLIGCGGSLFYPFPMCFRFSHIYSDYDEPDASHWSGQRIHRQPHESYPRADGRERHELPGH